MVLYVYVMNDKVKEVYWLKFKKNINSGVKR